jgi:hypothetical protein
MFAPAGSKQPLSLRVNGRRANARTPTVMATESEAIQMSFRVRTFHSRPEMRACRKLDRFVAVAPRDDGRDK